MHLPKKTNSAVARRKRPDSGPVGRWLRSPGGHAVVAALLWLLALSGVAAAGVWGLHRLEDYLLGPDQDGQVATVNIYMPNRPAWLPVSVAREIAADCAAAKMGFFDRDLLRAVHKRASANPWVRRVLSVQKRLSEDGQVGSIEIDCEYRKPVAMVGLDVSAEAGRNEAIYVDAEGVRLPTGQVPTLVGEWTDENGQPVVQTFVSASDAQSGCQFYQASYPLIATRVRQAPPVGRAFNDPGLADGIRLALLIADKPYANQISVIDVRNHGGQLDPNDSHIKMIAQIGRGQCTEIQFGRFPRPDGPDVVLPTERKLAHLDYYASIHNGLVAGIDAEISLQYDDLYAHGSP